MVKTDLHTGRQADRQRRLWRSSDPRFGNCSLRTRHKSNQSHAPGFIAVHQPTSYPPSHLSSCETPGNFVVSRSSYCVKPAGDCTCVHSFTLFRVEPLSVLIIMWEVIVFQTTKRNYSEGVKACTATL